jgi:hypothetical protein
MGISDSVGGMLNKAKDAMRGHSDKTHDTMDKGADMAADRTDDMTGGKHSDQIDKGRDMGADKGKDAMDRFNES